MKGSESEGKGVVSKEMVQFDEAMTQPRRISSKPGWPKVTWCRIFIRASSLLGKDVIRLCSWNSGTNPRKCRQDALTKGIKTWRSR